MPVDMRSLIFWWTDTTLEIPLSFTPDFVLLRFCAQANYWNELLDLFSYNNYDYKMWDGDDCIFIEVEIPSIVDVYGGSLSNEQLGNEIQSWIDDPSFEMIGFLPFEEFMKQNKGRFICEQA